MKSLQAALRLPQPQVRPEAKFDPDFLPASG
jgi:hypothetical protein